jgi:hypothetical protein
MIGVYGDYRGDGGCGTAGWLVLVIILPFLGVSSGT